MERTEPRLWRTWLSADEAYSPVRRLNLIAKPYSSHEKALQAAASAACGNVIQALKDKLQCGSLAAFGFKGSVVEAPVAIHRQGWSLLHLQDWNKSIVREQTGSKLKIFDVRIYPVLHAEDAPRRLNGLGLGEVFHQFIIGDPEVTSLISGPRDRCYIESSLRDGYAPGRLSSYCWPLSTTASSVASELTHPFIFCTNETLPEPSRELNQLANALSERISALRKLLVDGKLAAHGTFAKSGSYGSIDRRQWARANISVDVESGDMVEWTGLDPNVLWTGVSLSDPANAGTMAATQRWSAAGSMLAPENDPPGLSAVTAPKGPIGANLSRGQASIHQAVMALWPEGTPAGVSAKSRARKIQEWQKDQGFDALSPRSIQRYFNAKA
jgi:hypothetical protein